MVVNYPAPVLRKRADEVKRIDEWVRNLVVRMKQLMVEHAGVGLAAPQVNVGLRVFVWAPSGKVEEARAIINPVLSNERGAVEGEEGCLSLPEIRTKVTRFQAVHIEGVDENGQPVALDLEEFPARVVQHENDHLDGILILDRMSPMAKLANRGKVKDLEAEWVEREGTKALRH